MKISKKNGCVYFDFLRKIVLEEIGLEFLGLRRPEYSGLLLIVVF